MCYNDIKIIHRQNDCEITAPAGLPEAHRLNGYKLTDELKEFYTVCGGLSLAPEEAYGTDHGVIVPPEIFCRQTPLSQPRTPLKCGKTRACMIHLNHGHASLLWISATGILL